jgi:nitrite reductase/ring-hydroxylating ferredoxin subunit
MFNRIIKWQLIFESKSELIDYFGTRSTALFKNTFGEIMLAREGEEFYAFQNKCPHQNKSLVGCSIKEGAIICPWHKYEFSCETGRGHGLYLEKYPLKFEVNGVFIGKEGWSLFG